jgi:surface antigen
MEQSIDKALEKLVSGETLPWRSEQANAAGSVTPVRTFQNHDGRWCREFTVQGEVSGEELQRRAIACRRGEYDWRVMLEILADEGAQGGASL